jgi:hypothetical protein
MTVATGCAQCGGVLREELGDPFCSSRCCREFHGVSVDRPERYPAAASVRELELLCLKCKAWLPDEEFYRHRGRPKRRFRGGWCRDCKREENKKRDRADNERARGRRRRARARESSATAAATGDE